MNKFLSRLADRFGFQPKIAKRNYAAAKINRLTNDWATVISSGDAEIKGDLKTLRARARELERNNDYARRYFKRSSIGGQKTIAASTDARRGLTCNVSHSARWLATDRS